MKRPFPLGSNFAQPVGTVVKSGPTVMTGLSKPPSEKDRQTKRCFLASRAVRRFAPPGRKPPDPFGLLSVPSRHQLGQIDRVPGYTTRTTAGESARRKIIRGPFQRKKGALVCVQARGCAPYPLSLTLAANEVNGVRGCMG